MKKIATTISLIVMARVLPMCSIANDNLSDTNACKAVAKRSIPSQGVDSEKYYEVNLSRKSGEPQRMLVVQNSPQRGMEIYMVTPQGADKIFGDTSLDVESLCAPSVVELDDYTVICLAYSFGGSSDSGKTLVLKGNKLIDTGIVSPVFPIGGRDFYIGYEDFKGSYDGDIWVGHCYYQYPYYLDGNGMFVQYPAQFISLSEVEGLPDMTALNKEAREAGAKMKKVIQRGNGDVNINYMCESNGEKTAYFVVATRENGRLKWQPSEFGTLLHEGNMYLQRPPMEE